MGCLYLDTALALYRPDRNKMLFILLRIRKTAVYFKNRNWISKTVYCISCLVVCKIVVCSKLPDIPDNAGRKQEEEEEEHRQLQSVMRFTQVQNGTAQKMKFSTKEFFSKCDQIRS